MSLQIYLGQIWTQELIRLQSHTTLVYLQDYFSPLLPPTLSSHLPSAQRFPQFPPYYIVNFHLTISLFSLSSERFLPGLPTSSSRQDFYVSQPMCTSSRQLPKPVTGCHNSCFHLPPDFSKTLLRLEQPLEIQNLSASDIQALAKRRQLHWAKGCSLPGPILSQLEKPNPINLPPRHIQPNNKFYS